MSPRYLLAVKGILNFGFENLTVWAYLIVVWVGRKNTGKQETEKTAVQSFFGLFSTFYTSLPEP